MLKSTRNDDTSERIGLELDIYSSHALGRTKLLARWSALYMPYLIKQHDSELDWRPQREMLSARTDNESAIGADVSAVRHCSNDQISSQ